MIRRWPGHEKAPALCDLAATRCMAQDPGLPGRRRPAGRPLGNSQQSSLKDSKAGRFFLSLHAMDLAQRPRTGYPSHDGTPPGPRPAVPGFRLAAKRPAWVSKHSARCCRSLAGFTGCPLVSLVSMKTYLPLPGGPCTAVMASASIWHSGSVAAMIYVKPDAPLQRRGPLGPPNDPTDPGAEQYKTILPALLQGNGRHPKHTIQATTQAAPVEY